MGDWNNIVVLERFLTALAWTQPRILGIFLVNPIFSQNQLPGMLRLAASAGIGLMVAPMLMPSVMNPGMDVASAVLVIVKEAFVGLVLGCLIAVPFWAFEAVGFIIDNQRGASISATFNPITGNDSSPLGVLFNQAFVVFFFLSGGFLLMLDLVYDSFRLWNVFTWVPTLRGESVPVLIDQILGLVKLALLLSAPMVVAMLLAEMGLAVISRFVPQLQVFFLAMPIKSALAFLVLILYMATLFEYSGGLISRLRGVVPLLDDHWRVPSEVVR